MPNPNEGGSAVYTVLPWFDLLFNEIDPSATKSFKRPGVATSASAVLACLR